MSNTKLWVRPSLPTWSFNSRGLNHIAPLRPPVPFILAPLRLRPDPLPLRPSALSRSRPVVPSPLPPAPRLRLRRLPPPPSCLLRHSLLPRLRRSTPLALLSLSSSSPANSSARSSSTILPLASTTWPTRTGILRIWKRMKSLPFFCFPSHLLTPTPSPPPSSVPVIAPIPTDGQLPSVHP